MFPNLFIINSTGEVLIEKHWEGKAPRKVVETFMEQQVKKERKIDVTPVIETPKCFLVHSRRGDIVLLTAINKEVCLILRKPDLRWKLGRAWVYLVV
eukprot:922201-Amorphochlora_amoeboformis.AAC.2